MTQATVRNYGDDKVWRALQAVTGQLADTHVSPDFTGERHWLRRGRHGGCRGRAFICTASHPGKLGAWGSLGIQGRMVLDCRRYSRVSQV
jgi:hypothetical protein